MKTLRKETLLFLYTAFILFVIAKRSRAEAAIVSVVESMVGHTVTLPCLAIQHPHHSNPVLLLFYRPASNIPFFSYDARSGEFWREGTSKTKDPQYEGRVSLNLAQPRKIFLNLKKVSLEDEGQFTCRVDFLGSPTLTSIVDLRVFALPNQGPRITVRSTSSENSVTERSDTGPFYEGEMLNLSCYAIGGHPAPTLTWWQNSQQIDNTSQISERKMLKVTNGITIGPLTRSIVKDPFVCRMENNPLTPPKDKSMHIKVHMAPENVVLPQNPTVVAGNEEKLDCKAVGSYPEANISWALNNMPINYTSIETRQIGSDTLSWIQFKATPDNNGAQLSCTAQSPTLNIPPITAKTTLNVSHPPIVQLKMGSNLKPSQIRQGGDVYFDCLITANPPVQRIGWFKNGLDVLHNTDSGVIVGGTNLVLQSVQRSDAGNYSCRAENTIGKKESNFLRLSVQYAPMCAQGKMTVTAVEGEMVTLTCQVDAYPSSVSFEWLFNNTVDSTRFRQSEYSSEGASSSLRYVAYTARDYGTIYCSAKNFVGTQSDPCVFSLQPAGVPDRVRDCILKNQSAGSLHITCKPGMDGGLTQSFRAEVFAGNAESPVRVLEGMIPIFTVEGLAPGGDYVVRVTALNKKGSSIPVSLEAYTLKVAENRMISGVSSSSDPDASSSNNDEQVSPVLGVVAGVLAVTFMLGGVVFFIAKKRCMTLHRPPDLVTVQELEPCSGSTSLNLSISAKLRPKSGELITSMASEDVETDPFLTNNQETEPIGSCLQTGDMPGNISGENNAVFTIPANIPPPPQYCSASCTDTPHSQSPYAPCNISSQSNNQYSRSHIDSLGSVEPHNQPAPIPKMCDSRLSSPVSSQPCSYAPHFRNNMGPLVPLNVQYSPSCSDSINTPQCESIRSTCCADSTQDSQRYFSPSLHSDDRGRVVPYSTVEDVIKDRSSPNNQHVSWSPSSHDVCYGEDTSPIRPL